VNEYLSAEAIAQRLGVSQETVNRWCRTGQLKASKAGRVWRVRPADLEAFLSRHEAGGEVKKADALALSY
jgi:excisionase family DNA binding protein